MQLYRQLYKMGKAWGKEEDANLEHSDLSHRYLLHHLVVFALQELLDCDELSRLLVFTLEHHAVASLANQPQVIILLHAATRGYDARASYLQVNINIETLGYARASYLQVYTVSTLRPGVRQGLLPANIHHH